MVLKLPFRPDPFVAALLSAVVLASLLPCRGGIADILHLITQAAIVLVFFLHGARLSRQAMVQGLSRWKLHLAVFACTFCLFPLIGLSLRMGLGGVIEPAIAAGLLYLCLLPSTVQSSVAMTAIAGGNVPAAVCSASSSQIIGIVLTPLLVSLFMPGETLGGGAVGLDQIRTIALQLLLPFVVGHLSRPWTASWLETRKRLTMTADRGAIVLLVYTAFSAAVVDGLWRRMSGTDLLTMLALAAVLLAVVLAATVATAKLLRLPLEDEIALVFCGSQKGMAAGVPMAGVLFPAASVGVLVLPLMAYHQMQLIVAAMLAQRYAAKRKTVDLA